VYRYPVYNQQRVLHQSIALREKHIYGARLSEDDILSFCDLLLVPGIHYISFGTIKAGRHVINSFIEFLKCYHTIGFIDRVGSSNRGMNLYELFFSYKTDEQLRQALERFFIEDFTYDFIWIIYPKSSESRAFIHAFLDYVLAFNVDQKIPIVFIGS
jgi:hypothetical protein